MAAPRLTPTVAHLRYVSSLSLALALFLAGCSDERPAATVDDVPISLQEATAAAEAEAVTAVGGEEVREALVGLIFHRAIAGAAAAEFGIIVSDAMIDERMSAPPPRWHALFASLEEAEAPDSLRRQQASLTLLRDAVVPQLVTAEGSLPHFIADNPDVVTTACVQLLAVGDEALARTAQQRLVGGEDFATVAASLRESDPSGVGVLDNTEQCPESVAALSVPLAALTLAAEVGRFEEPVPVDGQWVVLRVTRRSVAAADGSDLMEHLDPSVASSLFTPWANDAVRAAEIVIDPTIGSWSQAGVAILPPE